MTYGSVDDNKKEGDALLPTTSPSASPRGATGSQRRVSLTDVVSAGQHQRSQRRLLHRNQSHRRTRSSILRRRQKHGLDADEDNNNNKSAVFHQIFSNIENSKSQQESSCSSSRLFSSSSSSSSHHHHSWIYTMLNPRSTKPQAKIFKNFIATVIVVDLIFFIMSTDPNYKDYGIFHHVEGITSSIFLIEYILRLITCMESKSYQEYGPIFGRLKYTITFSALIDALATFPFFIELLFRGNIELPTLTYVRIFRLLRILKTEAYAKAFDALWRVFYYNREILSVAGLVCLFLIVLTAVLLYYARPPPGKHKDEFESIAATMYISTLMLTGQGGPDPENFPWYTRIVVLLTGVFSIAVFAIPASMLTWGFEAEAERLAAASRRRKKRANVLGDGDDNDGDGGGNGSSSSDWESDGYSTDEEYMKIIAGGEDDEPTDEEKIQMLLKVFQSADTDHSGGLNPEEFVKFLKDNVGAVSDLMKGGDGSGDGGGGELGSGERAVVDVKLRNRVRNLEEKVHAMDKKLDLVLAAVTKNK